MNFKPVSTYAFHLTEPCRVFFTPVGFRTLLPYLSDDGEIPCLLVSNHTEYGTKNFVYMSLPWNANHFLY